MIVPGAREEEDGAVGIRVAICLVAVMAIMYDDRWVLADVLEKRCGGWSVDTIFTPSIRT